MKLVFAIMSFILAGIGICQASVDKESRIGQLFLFIYLIINGFLLLS